MGGIGHTSCLYALTRITSQSRVALRSDDENRAYLISTPASQGGIGDLALTALPDVGLWFWGGNSISENVGRNT